MNNKFENWLIKREGVNHLGEKEYHDYNAWRRAAKAAGAVSFDGDKDICQALKADGTGVGQWEGDTGYINKQTV